MRQLLLSVMLFLAALPCLAPAQERRTTASTRMRFADMDSNNDRVITRAEWRGTDASFRLHDWNGDGVLSRGEVRIGTWRPVRSSPPADFGNPDVAYVFADWSLAGFHRLDHNRDSVISSDEWHFHREAFVRADHNRDNALNRVEFLGATNAAEDDDREDPFENLDADGDSRVSRQEWHGGSARFAALDADHNQSLSREELTGSPSVAPDLFSSIDVNRDAAVTRDEWHWSRASFDARDLNGDGRITREEALSGGVPPAQEQAHRDGFARGYADGRQTGIRDRERGLDWNLENRPELASADAGFSPDAAPNTRGAYQAGYREGFRRGYRDGYSP